MIRKPTSLLAAMLAASLAFAPALAEARAGGGTSAGSRGTRTYQSAPATPTAPAARPVERSATPPSQTQPGQTQPGQAQQPRPAQTTPTAPQPQPGFFQRPFMAGLMGGLIGAGIGGLLFGGGLFGGAGLGGLGFGGVLGLLLQLALVFFAVRFAMQFFRNRQPQPAMAGGPQAYEPVTDIPPAGQARMAEDALVGAGSLQIAEPDFEAFQQTLSDIQAAWSKGDLEALRRHATPEMVGYFGRELSLLASKGLTNHVEAVTLEQGDLSEAWREDGIDYATVAMRWSALDYTTREDGSLAEGSRTERGMSTEIWTFLRSTAGGKWLLSAIQQPGQ